MQGSPIPALGSFRRYGEVLSWLLREIASLAPARLALGVAASVLAVATRAGALGVVLAYVHARTSGARFERLGLALPTDASLSTVALWAGLGGAAALVSAASGYLASALAFDLARRWVGRVARGVFGALTRRTPLRFPSSFETGQTGERVAVNHLLLRDMIMTQQMVTLLLRIPVPALTLVAAAAAMLATSARLTGLVLLFAVAFVVPLLVVSRRVVEGTRRRERAQREAAFAVGQLVAWLRERESRPDDAEAWARAYLGDARMLDTIEALHDTQLAGNRVEAVRDVFQGAVVAAALFAVALSATTAQPDWTLLLTYFGAFAYFSASLGTSSRLLTDANRFFPALRRVREFLAANAEAPAPAPAGPRELGEVVVAGGALSGSAPRAALAPGTRALYLDPRRLSAYDAEALLAPLAAAAGIAPEALRAEAFYCGDPSAAPAVPAALAAGDAERVAAFAAIGARPHEARLSELSFDERVALALAPALARPPRLCVVGHDALATVSDAAREGLFAGLRGSAVLLHARELPAAPLACDAVLVSDGKRLIGIGSAAWAESHRRELPAAAPEEARGVASDVGEEPIA